MRRNWRIYLPLVFLIGICSATHFFVGMPAQAKNLLPAGIHRIKHVVWIIVSVR